MSDDAPSFEPAQGLPGTSGRRFSVHSCLGRGGFGEVYRATMVSSGGVRAEVAIKVLRGDIDPGSDSVKRLRDEGRLLGALRHPAILRVHDLVLLENRVALVTEYVEGDDLDRCMQPVMPTRALVGVVGEVAAALDVAWTAPSPLTGDPINLIHRDVKPANIRIGRHGEVKLLDFGIARATNVAREAQTANNAMMGSYLYMSPERFHEERVEPPADVYALGCILYEGLASQRLFDGMTLKQIYGTMLLTRKFNAHLQARFQLVPAETDRAVFALMEQMLAAEPGARPPAAEVARRCEDLVEVLPGAALKRWARSRDWPLPEAILGTLDGRELTAQSFGVSAARSAAEETFIAEQEDAAAALADVTADTGGTTGSLALPPIDMGIPALGAYTETPAPSIRRSEPPLSDPAPPVRADVAGTTLVAPLDAEVDDDSEPEDPATGADPEPQVEPLSEEPPTTALPAVVAPATTWTSTTPDPRPRMANLPAEPGLGALLGREEPALSFDPITDPRIDPMPGVLDQPAPTRSYDDDFDRQLATMQDAGRRRNTAIALGVGALVMVALLVGGLYVVWTQLSTPSQPQTADAHRDPEGGLAPTPTPPDPAPAALVDPDPAPEPAKVGKVGKKAHVDPAPDPGRDPAPEPAPAGGDPKKLVDQGWKVVERDPSKALAMFEEAVALRPDAESYYGYGYALMQLNRTNEATTALCKAVTQGGPTLQREVKSVMGEKGLTCP